MAESAPMGVRPSRRAALALCAAASALLALEAGVRLARPRAVRSVRRAEADGDLLARMFRPSDVPGLEYELQPGGGGELIRAWASVNALGLRGPEARVERRPGTARVAFLGDSYAFGMGVEDGDTIAVRLQQLLERDGRPELEYEVLNFGVPGYSTRDESLQAGARLPAFGADAVVLLYSWNDPELHPTNFVHDCYHRPSWWEASWALQLFEGLTPAEYPAAFRTLHDPRSDAWRSVERGFLRIGEVARGLGAPALLVILPEMSQPTWEGYEYRAIHAQIGDAGRSAGMRVADLLDDAPAQAPHPGDMLLEHDTHTNRLANAGIAAVMARELALMRPELFARPPVR